jgi:hypothetical protein
MAFELNPAFGLHKLRGADPAPPHFAASQVAAETSSRELGLDRTLAETFPCSDPLSSIPNPLL